MLKGEGGAYTRVLAVCHASLFRIGSDTDPRLLVGAMLTPIDRLVGHTGALD